MRLSDHFTLAESMKSQVALRQGLDNTPPAVLIPRLVRVATQILEPVRKEFRKGFSPTSWYRCPVLNAAIGSKPTSQHMTGRAVDFEVPGVANDALARWCAAHLTFDQLILEFYQDGEPSSGWVHCSLSEAGARDGLGRGEILTITKDHTRIGLPE